MTDSITAKARRYESTRVHGNRWGYRGVEWEASRGMFRARIEPIAGRRGKWLGRFPTAEAAARAYDEAAREAYGDDAHLNFPERGEQPVQVSTLRIGLCPEGHDLNIYGRINVAGAPFCGECNLAAAKRYYARKVAARSVTNAE